MKYYEVTFTISGPESLMQDARDILSALAGEAGFETFEEQPDGITGYIQQALWQPSVLQSLLEDFPLPHCHITYSVEEAEDRDWNEQWEQEGFEPIVVRGERTVIIHDGRHLLDKSDLSPLSSLLSPLEIEIDTRLAFGTGNHETTRMMVAALLDMDLQDKRVLDCGTGTGILAITALKCGAAEAVGYDIDEWSVDNARHNAVINGVDERFTPLLGDSSILNKVEGCFDVVTANINRNILLADMGAFAAKTVPDGNLLLSGFYTADIPLLTTEASRHGFTVVARQEENGWASVVLRKIED